MRVQKDMSSPGSHMDQERKETEEEFTSKQVRQCQANFPHRLEGESDLCGQRFKRHPLKCSCLFCRIFLPTSWNTVLANLHSLKQIKTSNRPAQSNITETVVQKGYLKILPCGTLEQSSEAGFLTQHPLHYREQVPNVPELREERGYCR